MYRRLDWHELSRRAGVPFVVFALVTWAIAWHLGARRPAPDLYPLLKKSWPGADFVELASGGFQAPGAGRRLRDERHGVGLQRTDHMCLELVPGARCPDDAACQ
jgi:hypothetical protein